MKVTITERSNVLLILFMINTYDNLILVLNDSITIPMLWALSHTLQFFISDQVLKSIKYTAKAFF